MQRANVSAINRLIATKIRNLSENPALAHSTFRILLTVSRLYIAKRLIQYNNFACERHILDKKVRVRSTQLFIYL